MPPSRTRKNENTTAGNLLQLSEKHDPTVVTQLSNERSLEISIDAYKGSGYLQYFTNKVKSLQTILVDDLRNADVEVTTGSVVSHLRDVCGVYCRDQRSCVHVISEKDCAVALCTESEHEARTIVACDPIQTKLRDDCVECFPRVNKSTKGEELVVRVHMFYPNIPCMSTCDQRARLVTKKQFVPTSTRSSQGFHTFNNAKRRHDKYTPDCESIFPYTSGNDAVGSGFSLESKCFAITVESVFVRNQQRREAPFYAEDPKQTSVYFSFLCLTATVTDDELMSYLPVVLDKSAAMPALAADHNLEKYNVLLRLYLLSYDQGWNVLLPRGCPRPLGRKGGPRVLLNSCVTNLEVRNGRSNKSPVMLCQKMLPNMASQISRFCLRGIASEALRQSVVASVAENRNHYVPVVCYMPHSSHFPLFTDKQIGTLARLYPQLSLRIPQNRSQWAHMSRMLYKHGISVFDILAAADCPLRDAHGTIIDTSEYVPYTADMVDDYFLIIANRPLRDYISTTAQRWLHDHLMMPGHRPPISAGAFAAWVRYWNAMSNLGDELKSQATVDTLSAHLGLRVPRNVKKQRATCLVNGNVTDEEGGLIFPELGNQRFRDPKLPKLLPGTPVVYRFSRNGDLHFTFVPTPVHFMRGLPSYRE